MGGTRTLAHSSSRWEIEMEVDRMGGRGEGFLGGGDGAGSKMRIQAAFYGQIIKVFWRSVHR